MKIKTQTCGELTVSKEQVLTFPDGIIGFEDIHSYALLDSPVAPFHILQSTSDPNLAFILINPYFVRKDFVLEIDNKALDTIKFEKEEELLVFALVTIPRDDPQKISCNLLGPIIINRKNKLACQAISTNNKWCTKHFILEEADIIRDAEGTKMESADNSKKNGTEMLKNLSKESNKVTIVQSKQDYAYTQS